jgi:uncharacterized membrane protein
MKKITSIILSIVLLLSTIAHIVTPEIYNELIPELFPKYIINIITGTIEALIGIALLLNKYRSIGGLAFSLLMFVFLPIHILDMMKENPFIGKTPIPEIRIFFQLFLIYTGWWIFKK